MKSVVFVLLPLVLVAGLTAGQEAKAPTLTDVQRLRIQNLSQHMEVVQLKAQLLQREFDGVRDELTTLVVSLQVKGYTLDLSSLTYQLEVKDKKTP